MIGHRLRRATRIATAVVVLLAGARNSTTAETRPRYGGTVIGGLLGQPVHLDPVKARSHTDMTISALLFDTLYRIDGKTPSGRLRISPHVATALPIAEGSAVRIPVRTDIVFHNQKPLRPRDILKSLQRVRKSATAGHLLASVRTIELRGQELVLTLTRATPELALSLAAPATAITPGGRAPSWRKAVGSGAFKLARWRPNEQRLVLAVNNRYFHGRPYVNKLDLRWFSRPDDEATAYEAGKSHFSVRDAVAYAGHTPKYRTKDASGPATVLAYVGFGRAGANANITVDRDFRKALSLAIERGGFRGVGSGERVSPTVHPVAAAVGGPAILPVEGRARLRDARAALVRAASSVRQLRARPDNGLRNFELELLVDRTRPDDQAIGAKVVTALFQLGVRARIVSLAAPAFAERVAKGACDLYIGQLAMPSAHPHSSLAAAFAVGGDSWSVQALRKATLDMNRASQEFAKRLPIVPLFHRALRVHHRSNVRGLHFDDSSRLAFGDLFFHGRVQRSR